MLRISATILQVFVPIAGLSALTCMLVGCIDFEFKTANSTRRPPKSLPADFYWHDSFSPILGVSREELLNWQRETDYNGAINSAGNRSAIGEQAIERIRDGHVKLFDMNHYIIDQHMISALQASSSIRAIRVGQRERNTDFSWIAEIPNLKILDIGGNDLRNSDLQWLSEIGSLMSLTISDCLLPNASPSWFPSMPNLVHLDASRVTFTNLHFQLMPELPELDRLELYASELSDVGFKEFPKKFPKLRLLWLVRNKTLTSESIPTFGELTNLRFIHLGSTEIERENLEYEQGSIPALSKMLPECIFHYGT